MQLTQALDAFCTHQRAQGRSEKTVAIYAHDLRQVFTGLDDHDLAARATTVTGLATSLIQRNWKQLAGAAFRPM